MSSPGDGDYPRRGTKKHEGEDEVIPLAIGISNLHSRIEAQGSNDGLRADDERVIDSPNQ